MNTLKGERVELRALEPSDLDFLHEIENDQSIWNISHTQTPYSRFTLKRYIENAHRDIYTVKQLRLAIMTTGDQKLVGLIDLFDFDPANRRAGIGIVISDQDRRKGYGHEALGLLVKYAFGHLGLHQLFANIDSGNAASKALFATFGFHLIGTKKQWNFHDGRFHDEDLYQLINNK